MNRMTKKRVGMVLAFSLTLTGAAAYIGIQQENTDKTEAAGSLTAGVSASLNASEVEALDVTAGVTSQLYDKTDVAVAANEKQMVAQGIEDTQTKEAVSENTTEDTSICGYKNLGIAQVQGSLNVRKKASTDSKVVGKMTDKDACEIVSVKGDWAKITSGKVEGYVKTEYLLTGDAAKNVAKKEITKVVTVNTTTLRVREKASEDSAILSLVGEGEDLVVEDTKDGWYKVEVDDILDLISVWYRDVLLYKATKDINGVIFSDQMKYIKESANTSSYEGIETILKALEKAKTRLKANVNFELVMELLLLTIKEN